MKQPNNPIVLIVGTRPEGIKMMPVYFALKKRGLPVILCSTMQHDQLLTEVFEVFNVQPDIDLSVMRLGQDLFYLTQAILQKTKELFKTIKPSLVVVQGDTTSSMAATLAAFYLHIPVAHIEAGLRTDDITTPFPEEMNRRFVGMIAAYHFTPTALATAHLLKEGIPHHKIICTGNTVVDALRIMQEMLAQGTVQLRHEIVQQITQAKQQNQKLMLLTMHRRESFNGGIIEALHAIKQFLQNNPDVRCLYPFHPNPHVVNAIETVGLSNLPNLHLCEPLAYPDLVSILTHADGVVTDSGGIQEEAVSLGKQVIVLRTVTERIEGCWAGLAHLVGTNAHAITTALHAWHSQTTPSSGTQTIYGDGYAAEKIAHSIAAHHATSSLLPIEKQTPAETFPAFQLQGISMQKLCILGLGYIGLPTAIIAAQAGLDVIGVDIDANRVQKINAGDPVIQEPEIYEKLQLVRTGSHFKATTAIESAEFFIIAVPTPFHEDKTADLAYVMTATEAIATVLKRGDTIILESTVPVGTTQKIADHLHALTGMQCGTDFYVAHCPERVLPGNIFHELVYNARIIGGIDKESAHKATAFYKQFVQGRLYITNATAAEMVKLVENSSRDVQIAFANQVASMAYAVGLDPFEVIELANKHPRVDILKPSCGVGGHCIAVDPWFLVESFPAHTQLLHAARSVNDAKPHQVMTAINYAVAQWQKTNTGTCTVLLLGATYKADVDDLRESPALFIASTLTKQASYTVLVCEPHVNKNKLPAELAPHTVTVAEGLERADIVVYLVGHKRFKAIDTKVLATKKILDFCGALHTPKPETTQQEYLFWPATSTIEAPTSYQSHKLHEDTV